MPGIHVPTLSQLDWIDKTKESLLVIPGAYWLCHKKSIYKFIFRYHRTMKNTTRFSYGRELFKIIRRIIKCHPTQGQQFGTQHLLVTYNCTFWTRQDKMFAIMKFQQRNNAAAFSHAFVLTIKTFPSLEHSLFDLKYPIVKEADAGTTFKDLNASLDTEEKIISTVIPATDKTSSRKSAICQNDGIRDSAIFQENLGERSDTTAEMQLDNTEHNTKFRYIQESKSVNCNAERCGKNLEQLSIDGLQEQSLRAKEIDETEIENAQIKEDKKSNLAIQKQTQHIQDVQKYKVSSSSKPFTETKDSNDWLLSNKLHFDEKLIEKDDTCTTINKDSLDDDKKTSREIIGPNNVPRYQYFTEMEVEDVESNSIMDQHKNLQTEMKNINKGCVPKTIKENSKSTRTKQKEIYNKMTNLEYQANDGQHTGTSLNTDDKQSGDNMHSKSCKTRKQKSRESERKTIPDKVLRSSNITDLVMEGLMFTIRQDQDSVAVIEQKTKLEVDEVLENSEKVETKAGEKCLLNSSLLRLENLVTMIDSPRNRNEQYKNRHGISKSANPPSFNTYSNDAVHNVNINFVDTGMYRLSVSNYDRHSARNHLNLYQHPCVPSNIKNNSDSCLAGIVTEHEQFKERQDCDNKRDKRHKNNIELRKQGDVIPETSSSKKLNACLRDTNSPMITDIEDSHKESMEGYYNSLPPYSSLNPNEIATKTTSVISKESSLMKSLRQEVNVPRIVSDKAITIEQMPPALQKTLRHTCRARRFSSTINSETLRQNERKLQHVALSKNTISEADVLLKDNSMDPNIANNSLSTKLTINSEKVKSDGVEACVTLDEDVPRPNRDTRVRSSKRKNETRTLRKDSSSKRGSPRKLQDITEEFYYDLLHVHNKDNAIRQRCLRQKQRSLNNLDNVKSGGKVRIEMLKFIQDITEGARVVVRRLNIDNKSNLLGKNSNLI
ncbi:PREDICTED: uncharacterized protein LOC105559078 isoform X2 [Vollenhovia emeryi]|uniref:uncharacterized protein LOC105559078 isoform X2 n=1 Tax=Vollenhovia emeryi TaxID=411798 RepID=UPI0005F56603|nr:PREDICTED: uncharacterized protein LOC105559078 isoform X2 [Vollenhovia emeryi]